MKITDEMVQWAAKAVSPEPGPFSVFTEKLVCKVITSALADGTHWLAPWEPTEAMNAAARALDGRAHDVQRASEQAHYIAMRDQYLADSSGPKIENTNGD